MTYYEELGVPQDASPDTIREAYRNVARLLHPDAQTNPVLKESAEGQMKRINHLYETLSDPECRRRYDQELVEPRDRPETIIIRQVRSGNQELKVSHRETWVWLGATAICATFIIWLGARDSSPPVVDPEPSTEHGAAKKPAATSSAGADRQRNDEITSLRGQLATANADRERLMRIIASLDGQRKFQPPPATPKPVPYTMPPANLIPMPLEASIPALEIPLPAVSLNPTPVAPVNEFRKAKWAGFWTYTQDRLENQSKGLFPPEFIQTVISEDRGRIRGQYHARFKIARSRISPDVNFQFEGSIAGTFGKFPWTGTAGARGEVQLRLVSDTMLEVAWVATDLGKSMGLASGTAVLKRKN